MKKIVFTLLTLFLTCAPALAQTATSVLDKCASVVSAKGGATASFTMTSAQYGNASGTISIKGQKFYMKSDVTTMWFDGTTLWTYMASSDEVNISTPTAQQLQLLNPYNFINLYKSGYTQTMTTSATAYDVHLTATGDQQKIKEAFISVDKKSYAPKVIKMLRGNKWTTFTVSGLTTATLSDDTFRFNKSAYPDAEIIDLR